MNPTFYCFPLAEERQEFLFHLFRRLVFGGAICQYEDTVYPYLHTLRALYKDVVSSVICRRSLTYIKFFAACNVRAKTLKKSKLEVLFSRSVADWTASERSGALLRFTPSMPPTVLRYPYFLIHFHATDNARVQVLRREHHQPPKMEPMERLRHSYLRTQAPYP